MKDGYSICFNEWALDNDIKNELGLLLIISSLCAEKGYCYATNKYFGELFDLPEQTISRKIKKLEEKGYITIEYKKRGCEILERYLRLTKMLTDDKQNCESTINKNVKENNIINNIINKEEIIKEEKVFEYFENKLGIITPKQYEIINQWLNEFSEEQIMEAIDIASNNGVNNMNYISKVLHNKPIKKDVPSWLYTENKREEMTEEEIKEMEELFAEFRERS